jgi:two-component system OmpR family sensor kinase
MDSCKKRLRDSVQLRLSASLSLAILIVAIVAGVFAFISAFDAAHEMQDDTLRQLAALFDRQQMTLTYPDAPSGAEHDDDSRVIVQYLADGSNALGTDDATPPLPFPLTLADGLATVTVHGEVYRTLVRTTKQGQRIVIAQENAIRDKDAR